MLALIDSNNFYVSAERVFQPELRGKAGCVLSNNDGCAISRSNEAKLLGVKMGTPYFMIREQQQAGTIQFGLRVRKKMVQTDISKVSIPITAF